jgi:hypothetical protein
MESTFSIHIVGEETGKVYSGEFTVRTSLSFRQQALADEIRRNIIGGNPQFVAPGIANVAFMAGQLAVRVVDAPKWWEEVGEGGIDLQDGNVLQKIFEQAVKADSDRKTKIQEEADKAETSLKKKK